ncbi:amidohydrolase [Saccharopolyspora sp. K220]|uniref:amidohydrolase family protein n=1 Tax=Saccharopolyspora soli TaxID=2926618 RepID=UPI001F560FCB|nr:amidohydrolase family protein [Saccharopolyspora soli]MCI2422249.1 amidohydrolase [Saccharopolyspora soli]
MGGTEAMSTIDCHAHVVPDELLAELARNSSGIDGVTARKAEQGWLVELPGAGERLVRERMCQAERRLAYLSTVGIDRQVVAPWLDVQPTPAMSAGAARSWARRLNEAISEHASEGSAGTFATVALDDPDTAAADLADAVEQDGMSGLILSTDPVHCENLADSRLDPLWTVAESLGVPVLLHPSSDGPSRVLPDSADFANAYCRLVDTSFAVARLILSGVLDRHPNLRLITVHGGGFLPFQSGRLDGAHRADRLASYQTERERPSDYLSDLYYDTVAMSASAIRFLVDLVGPERVLLGTDYPFALGDPDPVGTVESLALAPAASAAVLGGNIAGLMSGSERVRL